MSCSRPSVTGSERSGNPRGVTFYAFLTQASRLRTYNPSVARLSVLLVVGLALVPPQRAAARAWIDAAARPPAAIQKIQHVIVIMQENRSFDHYFGTYPGADGIAMSDGVPIACLPDPQNGGCQRPYVDHRDYVVGGPHGGLNHKNDVNGGRMDGFLAESENATSTCVFTANAGCPVDPVNVLGYHTASDIPNYWSYAQNFVLQDHMFEPNAS